MFELIKTGRMSRDEADKLAEMGVLPTLYGYTGGGETPIEKEESEVLRNRRSHEINTGKITIANRSKTTKFSYNPERIQYNEEDITKTKKKNDITVKAKSDSIIETETEYLYYTRGRQPGKVTFEAHKAEMEYIYKTCLLYTSPSPRDS